MLLTKRFMMSTQNLLLRMAQVDLMARALVKEQVEATLAQVVAREEQAAWETRLEKQVLLTRRFQSFAVVMRSPLDLLK